MPATNSASPDRLLTVTDVADRLRLSVALIYSMVNAGTLPALRVGNGRGSIRFREQDVLDYLTDCSVIGKRKQQPAQRHRKRVKQSQLKHLTVRKGVRV